MTKTKSTKHALLLSALSLLMCVSMLVGSTFAWFTDSVTSAGNKIQSGTLKLDLELLDKENGTWNSIKEDKTALFDYDLWEPGYTEVKMLKVENEGTLALKWYAKFVSENELGILADVIDVYVNPYGVLADASDVAYPADRNLEGYTHVGTLRDFVNTIETTTYGSLKAGESAYLGIALKMQESAGNGYQGKTLGAFDIMILATQDTVEADSFGADYDVDAKYPLVPESVATVDELAMVLADGGYAVMSNDAILTTTISMNGGVLDGNGNDISKEADNRTAIIDVAYGAVKNVNVSGIEVTKTIGRKEFEYVPELAITSADGLAESLSVENVATAGTPYAIGLDANGNAIYAKNSTFTNNVNIWNQSEAVFENCNFTVDEQANANGFAWIGLGGDMSFIGCHFDECIDFYTNVSGCSGTITFANCTFGASEISVDATVDFFVNNFEYSVDLYGGTFGAGDPGRTNFTCIVDGTTVWEATN